MDGNVYSKAENLTLLACDDGAPLCKADINGKGVSKKGTKRSINCHPSVKREEDGFTSTDTSFRQNTKSDRVKIESLIQEKVDINNKLVSHAHYVNEGQCHLWIEDGTIKLQRWLILCF